jgi:hypothetical protein
MSSKAFKNSLTRSLNSVLRVRDNLGLAKAEVKFLTRTWTGKRPGEGSVSDVIIPVIPSPSIIDYSHKLAIVQAGAIRQGDLILKHLSKDKFSREELLNQTKSPAIESFWDVNGILYKGVSCTDHLFSWSLQIRPVTAG